MKFKALKSVDGPVLASYTGPVPSDSQHYKVFKGPIIKKSKTAAKRFIIAEDEHVNYVAETCDNNDSQCEYMAGIYNERTKTLKFMKVPLCEFGVRVKRARIDKPEKERLETGKQWDRLALEFGSAKARKRIKEKSLYSIDEADLEIARTEYIPSLAAKIASDSRTQEQNSDKQSKSVGKKFDFRPPPHNKDATTPEEVYKLQDVAPDLDDVDVVPLFKAESSEARMDLIPIASPYMKSHLSSAIAANDVQKTKIILYLAYLIAFYRMGEEGQIGSRNFVEKKLKTASKSLINSLYNNFSETPAGVRTRAMFTKRASSKLLSYICVICLIIDDFKVEFGQLVTDLQLQKIKLTRFFKNVGCTIEALTKAEREMLGVSYRYAAEHKFAVLQIPFTIPDPTQKRMSKKTNA